MKNNAYWANRMKILEKSLLDNGYDYLLNVEKQYDLAVRDVSAQIGAWYQRFAKNNNITLAEAQRLLNTTELKEFKWTVEEYIKHGRANAVSQAWMKQLKNASARVHITRLESLKLQLLQQVEKLHGLQEKGLTSRLGEIYERGYLYTAFEIQKGIGVGWSLHGLTDSEINKVLARPWTLDKQTFSDRIWKNKQALINSVNTNLTQMIMRGDSPDKAIKAIADRFNVSKRQAGRLVMTESAAFANEARKDCFNELGVERFVIVETLDGDTCELCGQLDGKVFPMSEYAVGVTCPPFHPWCRGTTAPYYEDLEGIGERAARDENGEYYTMPKETTFEQWKEKFVKKSFTSAGGSVIIDTVAKARDALINQVGFDSIDDSFKTVDSELAIANTNQLVTLEDRFGVIHKSHGDIRSAIDKTDAGTVAYTISRYTYPTEQSLSLCPAYYGDKKVMLDSVLKDLKTGYCMPCAATDAELMVYMASHEYGHMLQNTLVESMMKARGWNPKNPKAFMDMTKATAEEKLKWYIDVFNEVESRCYNEILAIAERNNKNFSLEKCISKYGNPEKSKSEFFAEVFANSQLSEPNELGLAMQEWLEKKGLMK